MGLKKSPLTIVLFILLVIGLGLYIRAPENGEAQVTTPSLDPRTIMLVDMFDNINDLDQLDAIVDEIYHPQATFKDPVQSANNREEIRGVLRLLGFFLEYVETDIRKDVASEDALAIHWFMTFKLWFWPIPATIPGVTWMDLDEQGKCVAQVDYWDLGEFISQVFFGKPPPAAD